MYRARVWLALCLTATIFGCGGSNNETASPTATSSPTATATLVPSRAPSETATFIASPTATATRVPPTATATCACTPTPTATATATATPTEAAALFSADPLNPANPFPSDRLLDDTGHVHVTGSLVGADLPPTSQFNVARNLANTIADQLTALTGFSTYAPIRVKVNRAVTIAGENPDGVLVLQLDDLSVAPPIMVKAVTPDISGDYAIEIYPVVPLQPKTRYVYVVTRAVHDDAGDPLQPSPDLTAALAATTPWRTTLDPVLTYLHDQRGINLDDIVAIDFFTTQPITDDLIAIKDLFATGKLQPADPVFENSPVPGLATGIFPEGTPQFTDLIGSSTSTNVSAVAIGSFDSYDFRSADGVFDATLLSGQVTPGVNHLDFYMTIPKAPAPPGGYPITIFGHGLGGSGRNVIFVSQLVGDAPMMAIAISDVSHGLRGDVSNFFDLNNGFVTRENFRQTVADYLQLERMVRHATVPPFDQVNKDRINYMGVSLGGIMGTLYMGVEPDVRVGMLSVPGGGLPNILQSHDIGNLLDPLISLTAHIPLDNPLFPVFLYRFEQLSQWFVDPADPINTAPYVVDPARRLEGVPPKLILMHEGIVDNTVPNATTDALALAMELPDVKATQGCSSSNGCSGIWRFVMTEYGQNQFSGHGVTALIPQAGAQAGHFLATDGQEISDASP
jgi:Bacterial virulence factor lipase N-terminal